MANLDDLEVFARVASSGSMSTAGRELGYAPTVVSKRIRRLEERLGTRLLHRTTKHLSLTEAGQGFYNRVVGVLASLEEAELYASGRSTEAVGVLRVTAPTSFGRMHLAPHLVKFLGAHPNLSMELVLNDQFSDIVSEGFDLAIRISELADTSLVARRLAPVRRILCASPGYVEQHGLPATIENLKGHFCLAAHNNEPWRLVGPEGSLAFRPQGTLRTNSSEVIREAVISGLGIALRSTWDIGQELKAGALVQVLPQYEGSPGITVSALYPSRQFLPAKVRLFIDFLAGLYGPTPYWEM